MTHKYINITTGFQVFQVIRFGFLLLISICLSRIFADKTLIGHYEKLLLLATSLSFFWVSGIFNALVPVYQSASLQDRPALLSQSFYSGSVVSLHSLAILLAIGYWIYPEIPLQALIWFGVFFFFNCSSFLLEYIFILRDQKWNLMIYGFLFYAAYFLAVILPQYLGYDLATAMQWLALVGFLRFVTQLMVGGKDMLLPRWRRDLFQTHWKMAWPLMLALLLGGSTGYIDSFLVSTFFSNDDFAIFSYGAKELPVIALVANALGTVKSGEIAAQRKEGNIESVLSSLKKSSLRLMHLFFPFSLVLLFLSRFLFTHVFNQGFGDASLIFDIYLLLIIPRLLFPQSVLKGFLETRVILITSALEMVLNVGLSLIFMQFWGLTGIAAATVIAYLFDKAVLAFWCQSRLKIPVTAYHPLWIWLIYSLILAGAYGLKVLV
ncbi:MAG: polysaccharide biosynthesis C-terminal domain-containing protein [Bacteroidia bacterium]|nr:polysaccharide biosynthesis C-terminal domain-containing protein [Bacteroidia bacterium]